MQDDAEMETCGRCLHENAIWRAPSPLWNAVMRGGSINGESLYGDMVCAACFMSLAEAKGIATSFRVTADEVFVPLQTVTPSGRVWDEDTWLWRDTEARPDAQEAVRLLREAADVMRDAHDQLMADKDSFEQVKSCTLISIDKEELDAAVENCAVNMRALGKSVDKLDTYLASMGEAQ